MNPSSHLRPILSVVIVTWNVREYVVRCLQSLERHRGDLQLEVIVVDNASSDGTAEELAHRFPTVRLIREAANRGFPVANNIGITHVTGEHLLLLNPDTEICEGCLQSCLKVLETESTVGMVGCKLTYPTGDVQYECACAMPSLADLVIEAMYLHVVMPQHRLCGRLRMSYWDHEDSRCIPRICGAFMMIRGEAYRRVGPLDEKFFMYYEDLDYCARVAEAGYMIYYLASARTIHYGGKAREKSSLALDELGPEVKHAFFRDHRGRAEALVYRVMCGVQNIVRIVIAAVITLAGPRTLRTRPIGRCGLHWARLLWCLGFPSRKAPRTSDGIVTRDDSEMVLGEGQAL